MRTVKPHHCSHARTLLQSLAGGCLVVAAASVLVSQPLVAQTRRALLIGINTYHYSPAVASRWRASLPREVLATRGTGGDRRADMPDLDGAVSDARAMATVLSGKYGFQSVDTLYDQQATRAGIIAAIRHLIDSSRPGDVAVFYYAGHGSQRYNSAAPASASANKLDQTIVPADANVGQFDLRNAELTALFNELLAKDVKLTLIFDSCNSGSAVRGVTPPKLRYAPFDPRDARDPSDPESLTRPGRRNPALFVAAAQENQSAAEEPGGAHGAFTGALLRVLASSATTVNAPARQIFRQVEAALRWSSVSQVPVLKGTDAARDRPLFGPYSGAAASHTVLALQGLTGAQVDTAILDGGTSLGIGTGTELRLLADGDKAPLRLRVVSSDLGTSRAVAVAGKLAESPGAAFVVEKWVLPVEAQLRVWVAPDVTAEQLASAFTSLSALRTSNAMDWVSDPTAMAEDGRPLYTVVHEPGKWSVRTPWNTLVALGSPTAEEVTRVVAAQQRHAADSIRVVNAKRQDLGLSPLPEPGRPYLFVMLPPTDSLQRALRTELGTGSQVQLTDRPDGTQYMLVGRENATGVSYAWMLRDASPQMVRRSPIPARTEWFDAASPDKAASQLALWGGRLARLEYWQTVQSHNPHPFPYHLALRRSDTTGVPEKMAGDTISNRGGEQYRLVLRRDTSVHEPAMPQWIYVFALDRTGLGSLLFGQSSNHLPERGGAAPATASDEIPLPMRAPITICPTYGTDTFVMVASERPIGSPESTFDFPAVEVLRSTVVSTDPSPDDWSVERIWLRSEPPPASAERLLSQGTQACRMSRQQLLDPGFP
jgi:hypothetical protein